MSKKTYQDEINKELDRFTTLLNDALPRYTFLIKKSNLKEEELNELGDLEYFLIEINGKISQLKKQLEHDLFGLSLDLYYKLKNQALNGDIAASKKVVMMREAFNKSLKTNHFINWN